MDFENFEGYKEVKNEKNLTIEEIYALLERYEENIGKLAYDIYEGTSIEITEIGENYVIRIYLKGDSIAIERKAIHEEENNESNFENGKTVELASVDRIIEQIFDMLKDYMPDEIITEHITKAKAVYLMQQVEGTKAFGVIPAGNSYIIKENDTEIYNVKQNLLNSMYTVKNLKSKREELSIKYEAELLDVFNVLRPPFENTTITKDESNDIKTVFKGKVENKEFKISADYTDNHYLIELNEIVIGAVDCLDPETKENYRLEVNDLKYEFLVIATSVIADLYSDELRKNK